MRSLLYSSCTVQENLVTRLMRARRTTPDYLRRLNDSFGRHQVKSYDIRVFLIVDVLLRKQVRQPTGQDKRTANHLVDQINSLVRLYVKGQKLMAKYRTRVDTGWKFANIRLDKQQRDEFITWHESLADDAVEVITAVLLEGYKLTVRYDEENETWIATLTGIEGNRRNVKTSMSARHSDLSTVLVLVAYKHIVVCNSGSWELEAPDEEWG